MDVTMWAIYLQAFYRIFLGLIFLLSSVSKLRDVMGFRRTINNFQILQQAPDFRAEQLSGENITLATYTGHEVAFVFVSPGCKPCDEALPSYEMAFADAARAGIDFVLVSTVDANLTRRYVEEKAIALPMLIAPRNSNPFMDAYHLSGTPSYCVIDAQGKVQASGFAINSLRPWQVLVESWKIRAERVGV